MRRLTRKQKLWLQSAWLCVCGMLNDGCRLKCSRAHCDVKRPPDPERRVA